MTAITTQPEAKRPRFGKRWFGFALALPAIISVLLVIIWPLLNTIVLSLEKIDIFTQTTKFVGLQNYIKLFQDAQFLHSLKTTVIYGGSVLILATVFGLLFALLLNERFPGRGFFRAILILPWALPWVIIGLLWNWVADGQFGAINGLLYQLGIIKQYVPFLSRDGWALFFCIIACVWRQASYSGILYLAALQSIPSDQYEAATVDGAGIFQRFAYITMPWLMPTVMIAAIINTLYGIMQFDLVFMLTQGGPGDATMLLSILLQRKTFIFSDFGGGAAVSNILALLCLGIGLLFVRMLYRSEREIES